MYFIAPRRAREVKEESGDQNCRLSEKTAN
jgi:hypothetical protein